jgi:hypothetical protein
LKHFQSSRCNAEGKCWVQLISPTIPWKKLKLNTRRSYQKLFFAALVNNNPKTIFNQILKYSMGWFNIKILYYSFNPNITSKQAK